MAQTVTKFDSATNYQLIKKALERAGTDIYYSPEWIMDEIKAKRMQLWRFGDALAVTQLENYPTGLRELNIFIVSGENLPFEEMIDVLAAYGKSHGCSTLSGGGRKGWVKKTDRLGDWKTNYRVHRRL
jgi:hypothetical protein